MPFTSLAFFGWHGDDLLNVRPEKTRPFAAAKGDYGMLL